MTFVDNAAIIWSVIIVITAVVFASAVSTSETTSDANNVSNQGSGNSNPVPNSFQIDTEKADYVKSDTIIISGSVGQILQGHSVTIRIIDSDDNLVTIAQVDVGDDLRFSHEIITRGNLWNNGGDYTILAMYGEKNTAETSFKLITPSVPKVSDVFSVNAENRVFSVGYGITNAVMRDMAKDSGCLCLTVIIDAQNDGMLVVDLPRGLVDSKISNGDDLFIILMDGIEIPYESISSNPQSRTISVEFAKNASEIEIIGTNQI